MSGWAPSLRACGGAAARTPGSAPSTRLWPLVVSRRLQIELRARRPAKRRIVSRLAPAHRLGCEGSWMRRFRRFHAVVEPRLRLRGPSTPLSALPLPSAAGRCTTPAPPRRAAKCGGRRTSEGEQPAIETALHSAQVEKTFLLQALRPPLSNQHRRAPGQREGCRRRRRNGVHGSGAHAPEPRGADRRRHRRHRQGAESPCRAL